ncbi:MarR family transcriptional regulator [Rhizobium sp. ACO-34A]|nr:MarR family winged helix-turn-helix transcriptional regulator [Rhizobium sp. ACO-34A]ATN33943.1 MarR family transcriptional regulator [Rhizobium sp. ACO-34A]
MTKSSCYCVTLRNASRRLTSLYDEALAPLGINVTQFSQLRNIGRFQPVSLTDLGKKMQLDRSTVGRNTKILERMGLVAAAPVEDHRENALVLTGKGEMMLERALPIWEGVQARIAKRLGPGGLEGIVSALDALVDDLAN